MVRSVVVSSKRAMEIMLRDGDDEEMGGDKKKRRKRQARTNAGLAGS
jgi:hypothetical protein